MRRVHELMPGEHVLWQGRPSVRAIARSPMHVRGLGFYLAAVWIWNAAESRASGLTPVETMAGGVPLLVVSVLVLLAAAGFAWACSRTTTYMVTTERCVLDYGVALAATLSIPLRRIASVSVTARADGTGDIPIELKPGRRMALLKLWPHARPWHWKEPQPMLRGVSGAMEIAALLSEAAATVSSGTVHPVRATRPGPLVPGTVLPGRAAGLHG